MGLLSPYSSRFTDDCGRQPAGSAQTAEEGVLARVLIDVEGLGIIALAKGYDLSCSDAVGA
jgi:hypothetical protein